MSQGAGRPTEFLPSVICRSLNPYYCAHQRSGSKIIAPACWAAFGLVNSTLRDLCKRERGFLMAGLWAMRRSSWEGRTTRWTALPRCGACSCRRATPPSSWLRTASGMSCQTLLLLPFLTRSVVSSCALQAVIIYLLYIEPTTLEILLTEEVRVQVEQVLLALYRLTAVNSWHVMQC